MNALVSRAGQPGPSGRRANGQGHWVRGSSELGVADTDLSNSVGSTCSIPYEFPTRAGLPYGPRIEFCARSRSVSCRATSVFATHVPDEPARSRWSRTDFSRSERELT